MKSKKQIKEEAIRWFLWLRENKAESSNIDVFNRWQVVDKSHKQTYEEIKSLWHMCDAIEDLPWPLPEELLKDSYDGSYPLPMMGSGSVSAKRITGRIKPGADAILTARALQNRRISMRQYGYAVAASLILVLGVATFVMNLNRESAVDAYYTSVAEQGSYTLEDGSRITLGPKTRVSFEFSRHQRYLSLLQGEAYFEVAKDPQRPFIVQAGGTSVEAVGTEFNINRRSASVVVSVVEGAIRLASQSIGKTTEQAQDIGVKVVKHRLVQGEQAVYEQAADDWKFQKVVSRATSWRNGSLAYVNERLDRVIEDVNRYSETKFIIGDREVGNLVFTGTVMNHQISDWMEGLVKTFPVRLLHFEDRIVLLSPLPASS